MNINVNQQQLQQKQDEQNQNTDQEKQYEDHEAILLNQAQIAIDERKNQHQQKNKIKDKFQKKDKILQQIDENTDFIETSFNSDKTNGSNLNFMIRNLDTGNFIEEEQLNQQQQNLTTIETSQDDDFDDLWQDYWEIDGWGALHYAVSEDNFQILELLIKQDDLKINLQTNFGRTALHLACIRGNLNMIKILLQQKDIQINIQDNDFNSPIHYAAQQGYKDIIEFILENYNQQINLDLRNYQQMTPLECVSDFQCMLLFQKYFKQVNYSQNYSRIVFNNQILKNGRADHVERILRLTKCNSDKSKHQNFNSDSKLQAQNQISPLKNNKLKKNNGFVTQVKIWIHQKNKELKRDALGPQDFKIIKMLGKGAFGQVYLVEKIEGDDKGSQYAMKILDKMKFFSKNLIKYAKTERNVLRIMKHPFIVQLKYSFQTEKNLYMIMDYAAGGDLNSILEYKLQLSENLVKIYACEILLALEALHKQEIIFRDLKPANVVIDADGHALLTDFGLSKEGQQQKAKTGSFCGSLAYMAPEMLKKKGHGQSIDWYLFGVLLHELALGETPYYANTKKKLLKNIESAKLKISKTLSPELRSLIQQLLIRDPEKRLGSQGDGEEVRNHPFFSDINWDDVYQRKLNPPKPKTINSYTNNFGITQDLKVTFSQENMKRHRSDEKNYVDNWSFMQSQIQTKPFDCN